jgi:toxin ParE1/3/4
VRDVVWSDSALDDMDLAAEYIAADNRTAALMVLDRIERTVESLSHTPTGRPGRVAGTYEKSVRGLPYIVAYALQRKPRAIERVIILRVIHAARNWPEGEWPE